MKRLKCYTIIGIIFVIITGTLFHFLYNWTDKNFIVGLFTPVNESVWEHMKLLFFPMLLYSFVMILNLKTDYPCITSSLCFGILIGALLIPTFFYAYTFILGKNTLFFDIKLVRNLTKNGGKVCFEKYSNMPVSLKKNLFWHQFLLA